MFDKGCEPNAKGAEGEAGGFDEAAPKENPVDAGAGEAGLEDGLPNGEGFDGAVAPKVKGEEAGGAEVEG